MRPNPYVLQALKYATITLVVLLVITVLYAVFRNTSSSSLTGRLVTPQENGIIPSFHFTADRAVQGLSAPANSHVIFEVPAGIRITRITFLGGPNADLERYWGYCFSGHEQQNKADGLTGAQLYDGKYFYSLGERKAQMARPTPGDNDLVGILDTAGKPAPEAKASIAEIFTGGQTCYVMSSVDLPVGIDSDNDDVNNALERMYGTNPNDPDTDHDGVPDGIEIFTASTNPLDPDTDHDGLPDGCEDANKNGKQEKGETSPIVADTDRDGLCDGDGNGAGCPEPKERVCYRKPSVGNEAGDQDCYSKLTTPVAGEDLNLNCTVDAGETDPTKAETFGMPDWEYKWNKFPSVHPGWRSSSASSVR